MGCSPGKRIMGGKAGHVFDGEQGQAMEGGGV